MEQRQQLLIIRPGAIGDTLLTMPLLQTIRQRHTDLTIHFVGHSLVLPFLQACKLIDHGSDYDAPQWSFFFLSPHTRTQRAARGLQQLHQQLHQYHSVFAWLQDETGTVAENLRAANIPCGIVAPGRPPVQDQRHITSYLASTLIQDWPGWKIWSAQQTWQPPAQLSWQPFSIEQRPIVALHPGSGGAHKCWPVSSFARLIRMLWHDGKDIMVLGGPADEERISQLQQLLGQPPAPSTLQLVQSEPLLSITQKLLHCQVYIGNDSGITHLAALLGMPTIALFGPSDPVVWHPIGPRITLLHAPELANLSPQLVYENIMLLQA